MKGKANTWFVLITGPFLALRYNAAARRDENNGAPFTAAMEWRKAAELSSWNSLLADRYWREWERIMRLPRHLAGPIGVQPAVDNALLHQHSLSSLELAMQPLPA
jgi:hypothetical protein